MIRTCNNAGGLLKGIRWFRIIYCDLLFAGAIADGVRMPQDGDLIPNAGNALVISENRNGTGQFEPLYRFHARTYPKPVDVFVNAETSVFIEYGYEEKQTLPETSPRNARLLIDVDSIAVAAGVEQQINIGVLTVISAAQFDKIAITVKNTGANPVTVDILSQSLANGDGVSGASSQATVVPAGETRFVMFKDIPTVPVLSFDSTDGTTVDYDAVGVL